MNWRRKVILLGLGLFAPFLGSARADIQVHDGDATCKDGIQGELIINGVSVLFESCPPDTGDAHAKIWMPSGGPLSEITLDTETLTGKVWIGGIEVTDSNTTLELQTITSVFEAPEAVVAKELTTELLKVGIDKTGPLMALARGVELPFYDENGMPLPSPELDCMECHSLIGDCLGCCGYGCSGCHTCHSACYEHDVCARDLGQVACLHLLADAVAAASICAHQWGLGGSFGCC